MNTSFDSDQTVTIAALGGAMIVSYVGTIARKEPVTIKPLLATFVTGGVLLGVGLWSGELAAMFAVLLLVTSLAVNGKTVFDTINKVAGTPIAKTVTI